MTSSKVLLVSIILTIAAAALLWLLLSSGASLRNSTLKDEVSGEAVSGLDPGRERAGLEVHSDHRDGTGSALSSTKPYAKPWPGFIDYFEGIVISDDGEPIQDAALVLRDNLRVIGNGTSDKLGRFEFGGLLPYQDLVLYTEKPGFADMRTYPNPSVRHTVVLPRGRTCHGRVVSSENGFPISHALIGGAPRGQRRHGTRHTQEKKTDKNGVFTLFIPVDSERLKLDVRHRDYESRSFWINVGEFQFSAEADLGDFQLDVREFREITFLAQSGDRPLAGVTIQYGACRFLRDAVLDEGFVFFDQDPELFTEVIPRCILGESVVGQKMLTTDAAGLCTVQIQASEKGPLLFSFVPRKGEFTPTFLILSIESAEIDGVVPVLIPPAKRWCGRVIDWNGKPVPGSRVRISLGESQGFSVLTTDADGLMKTLCPEHNLREDLVTDVQGCFSSHLSFDMPLKAQATHPATGATIAQTFLPPLDENEEVAIVFPAGAKVRLYPRSASVSGPLELTIAGGCLSGELCVRIDPRGTIIPWLGSGYYTLQGFSRGLSVFQDFSVAEGSDCVVVPFDVARVNFLTCTFSLERDGLDEAVGSTFTLGLIAQAKAGPDSLAMHSPRATLAPSGEIVFYPVLPGLYRLKGQGGFRLSGLWEPPVGYSPHEAVVDVQQDGLVFPFELKR